MAVGNGTWIRGSEATGRFVRNSEQVFLFLAGGSSFKMVVGVEPWRVRYVSARVWGQQKWPKNGSGRGSLCSWASSWCTFRGPWCHSRGGPLSSTALLLCKINIKITTWNIASFNYLTNVVLNSKCLLLKLDQHFRGNFNWTLKGQWQHLWPLDFKYGPSPGPVSFASIGRTLVLRDVFVSVPSQNNAFPSGCVTIIVLFISTTAAT